MEKRQAELLKQIIKVYVRTAEPVGSLYLAQKFGDVSSATIRNEMMELEEAGWIFQPHTSAGRVPTAKAFRFYVDNFVKADRIDKTLEKNILETVRQHEGESAVKEAAKAVAELTEAAVIVAFSANQLYYTGLSYLFSQPEFQELSHITSLSQILDHCEEVVPQVLESLDNKKKILIGEENPFGVECGFLVAPLFGDQGMFGILGPLRMDYDRNIGLINSVQKILNK